MGKIFIAWKKPAYRHFRVDGMYPVLLVGIGGSIGAMMRYGVGQMLPRSSYAFPWATFAVNVIGSYLLGLVLFGSMQKQIMGQDALTMFSVGLLGAFTTMSTFSYESLALFDKQQYGLVALHIIGTVLLTLMAVYAGKITANHLWKL